MHTYRLKGASGKVANQVVGLGERTLIGSAPECDVVLQEDGIAPRHAEIVQSVEGGLRLNNLEGSDGLYLNGLPVSESALGSGDEIRLGSSRWVLQAPGLRPKKILTADAVKPRRSLVPWLLVIALLTAAALAWQRGWLPF